jgi:hypothetical protein
MTAMADAFRVAAQGNSKTASLVIEAKRGKLFGMAKRSVGLSQKVRVFIARIDSVEQMDKAFEVLRRARRSSEDYYRAVDFLTPAKR